MCVSSLFRGDLRKSRSRREDEKVRRANPIKCINKWITVASNLYNLLRNILRNYMGHTSEYSHFKIRRLGGLSNGSSLPFTEGCPWRMTSSSLPLPLAHHQLLCCQRKYTGRKQRNAVMNLCCLSSRIRITHL